VARGKSLHHDQLYILPVKAVRRDQAVIVDYVLLYLTTIEMWSVVIFKQNSLPAYVNDDSIIVYGSIG
jgi:hypothetical protein